MNGEPATPRVDRGAVIAAARASERRVVGVTAPAGYGKSALIAQWAADDGRSAGRAALDLSHDDPAAFVDALTQAFHEGIGEDRPTDAAGSGSPEGAAHRLAQRMRGSGRPFVLLVDDLQVVRDPHCHALLGMLAAAVPSGSQLVTASRHVQPHLARARAGRDAWEVSPTDLALDAREIAALLRAEGMGATADQVDRVLGATQGWPAGILLAALTARDARTPVAQTRGDDRHVADYLRTEVLDGLDQDLRDFLCRASVVPRPNGDLCDVLLERSDSAVRLDELSRTVLFLLPERQGSYRWHRMFREFLLGELRRTDARALDDLHRRAAAGSNDVGSRRDAVDHLIASGDALGAADAVASAAPSAWQEGDLATLERWIAELGEEVGAAHAGLAVVRAWVATVRESPEAALRALAVVDALARTAAGPSRADHALLRAAICPDGPESALADARAATARYEWADARRSQALVLGGEALLMLDRTDDAVECLLEAADDSVRHGHPGVALGARAMLAWIAMDRGEWDAGTRHTGEALRAAEATIGRAQPSRLLVHAATARMHLHAGAPGPARDALDQALRARATCTHARPFPAVKGRLEIAKLLWVTGDHAATRELLRELNDVFRVRPDLGVLRDELLAFVALVEDTTGTAETRAPTPLTPAELRVLPYLQTHLTIAEIGERLFVSRNTANSEIASIYRKLGASTRGDAVEKATLLGLLGR